jgi:hypothetical protein
MPPEELNGPPINAHPTKEFFVDMITKDISLEQAVLDLVDNSVDAARRFKVPGPNSLVGYVIAVQIEPDSFKIIDTCGGFDKKTARDYAFRFGRPVDREKSAHSIGQFGIGMKRALFKFGSYFDVCSATSAEKWAVSVDVARWQAETDWVFPWAEFPEDSKVSEQRPGTQIVVSRLRPEVAARFGTTLFINSIENLIRSKHRQFLVDGLSIVVNGRHLTATNLSLLVTGRLKPGVDTITFDDPGQASVEARIVTGVGDSIPKAAGWYVICNGRAVLEGNRSEETGWGIIEEEKGEILIPKFHNQFARFRGIVWFDSEDSARVPWNTMKTDVDRESRVWQQTFLRMIDMMRPVIDFLNDLDRDIEEHTRDGSALLKHVTQAFFVNSDEFRQRSPFKAPRSVDVPNPGPPTVKIQYSRPLADVEFLKDALDVGSAKGVGERTFDLTLQKQKG